MSGAEALNLPFVKRLNTCRSNRICGLRSLKKPQPRVSTLTSAHNSARPIPSSSAAASHPAGVRGNPLPRKFIGTKSLSASRFGGTPSCLSKCSRIRRQASIDGRRLPLSLRQQRREHVAAPEHQLATGVDVEPAIQPLHVAIYRMTADGQPLRDPFFPVPLQEAFEHLAQLQGQFGTWGLRAGQTSPTFARAAASTRRGSDGLTACFSADSSRRRQPDEARWSGSLVASLAGEWKM